MNETYWQRWLQLPASAWLYLLHAGLITSSLAIVSLFLNLAVLALGYSLDFLGLLNALSVAVAALLSLPLWWLATRLGPRQSLQLSALIYAVAIALIALWPSQLGLLAGVALTGMASVLFQVSAVPFMMRHSNDRSRDHLFSANWSVNVAGDGLGKLLAGGLPAALALWLGVNAESALAYRGAFGFAAVGLVLAIVPLLFIRETQSGGMPSQTLPVPDAPDPPIDSSAPAMPRRLLEQLLRYLRLPPSWQRMLLQPWPLIKLLIPPLLISCGAALLIPYLNLFFKQRFEIGDGTLGGIFAALSIVTGLASLAAPLLSQRIGKIGTLVLTQALSLPFLLLLGFAPFLSLAVAGGLARAALFNMGSPLYDAFAMERTPEDARTLVIGLINGTFSAAYLVAPFISTRVIGCCGFSPLFVATAVCYTLVVLVTYRLFMSQPR